MKDKSIVLSIRFKGDLEKIVAIRFFSEFINKHLGKSFEELNYTITDKSNYNWKQKDSSVKFSEKNLVKFSDTLNINIRENISVAFELLILKENYKFKSRDIDISLSYNESSKINALTFIINEKLSYKISWIDYIKSIIDFLKEKDCQTVYGFLFPLENSKLPIFYVEGIGNDEASDREQEMLSIWSNNKEYCDHRIWDIFWGNLLYLNGGIDLMLISEISEIVGKHNVELINPCLLWIKLNEALEDFDISKQNYEREKLRQYIKGKNLLMI